MSINCLLRTKVGDVLVISTHSDGRLSTRNQFLTGNFTVIDHSHHPGSSKDWDGKEYPAGLYPKVISKFDGNEVDVRYSYIHKIIKAK